MIDSFFRANAGTGRVNGHAADDVELENNALVPGLFHRVSVDGGVRRPLWRMWKSPGKTQRRNNEFLALLSHELRNSLSGIRCATGILRLDVSAAPNVAKARVLIERQVDQMTRLIEDLMDVSQIQSGQLRLQRERIDLCVLAAHAVEAVELTMQQRSHRMTTSFPGEPVWTDADPTRLEQVFVNLLVNAAKYTVAGGDIGLSIEQQDDEAIIRVRDTGIGIAADILPNVFDLFVQADRSSKRAAAGLGIGLALVRNLVESHGGHVSAASAGLGKGSEFTVRLPIA